MRFVSQAAQRPVLRTSTSLYSRCIKKVLLSSLLWLQLEPPAVPSMTDPTPIVTHKHSQQVGPHSDGTLPPAASTPVVFTLLIAGCSPHTWLPYPASRPHL